MSVSTYTKSGTKATTPVKLDKDVFGLSVDDHGLLKSAYVAYLANGRGNSAVVKTRGLVRGGGKKPWKQKGTGRARFGSSRNPIWRGGGIVFGPTGNENYTHNISTKDKNLALKQALSLASKENKLSVIETFDSKDGRVKYTNDLIKKLGLEGSILIVVSEKNSMAERATRNIVNVKLVSASYLNVFDTLNADNILLSKKSVEILNSRLNAIDKKSPTTQKEAK